MDNEGSVGGVWRAWATDKQLAAADSQMKSGLLIATAPRSGHFYVDNLASKSAFTSRQRQKYSRVFDISAAFSVDITLYCFARA